MICEEMDKQPAVMMEEPLAEREMAPFPQSPMGSDEVSPLLQAPRGESSAGSTVPVVESGVAVPRTEKVTSSASVLERRPPSGRVKRRPQYYGQDYVES